jgi:hypothetical protein
MKANINVTKKTNAVILTITIRLITFLFLSSFSGYSFAQTEDFDLSIKEQINQIQKNDADNPCITAMEYEIIEKRCAENVRLLNID